MWNNSFRQGSNSKKGNIVFTCFQGKQYQMKYLSVVVRKPAFAYAKIKAQISCAVTAQLISAFVFANRIVQSLYYLNPKFQASSHLLWLNSMVCVGSGRKLRRPVLSKRGSFHLLVFQGNNPPKTCNVVVFVGLNNAGKELSSSKC